MKKCKEDQHKAQVENTVWVQGEGGMKITNRMGIKIWINKRVYVCVCVCVCLLLNDALSCKHYAASVIEE